MYRILAIDGGGIRGIIPAWWLARLEERLGNPLYEHFDFVAGTSTGSIVAAGIAAGIPAETLVRFYREQGKNIFPPRGFRNDRKIWDLSFFIPKYEESPLRDVLKQNFLNLGTDLLYGELKLNCAVVAYDALNRRPRILRSWDPNDAALPIWEVCKASCSAPTYFPAHVIETAGVPCPLIDGGVVANNPASLALAEAIRKQRNTNLADFESTNHELILISLGTGNLTRRITVDEAQQWGKAQWALPILDVVFDGTSAADDMLCEAMLTEEQYIRLQVDLRAASDDLDDASDENIDELLADALRFYDEGEGRRKFDQIINLLSQ